MKMMISGGGEKYVMENGDRVFVFTHPKFGTVSIEPCSCKWLKEFCSNDSLLSDAPATSTVEYAKQLLAERPGAHLHITPLDHVRACGAGGTEVERRYMESHRAAENRR